MLAGSRVVPWILTQVARLRSRELFTLTVMVFSVALAAGSYALFGASMALGAFLAGMMVAQSPVSHQAAADALPLRDAFAVLFFVSVGMLFDPTFLAPRAADDAGGAGHHPARQAARRPAHRRAARPLGPHGPDRGPGAGPDRRVLVHPVRAGPQARPDARGRAQRAGRRGDPVDHPQPAAVPLPGPDRAVAPPSPPAVGAAQRPGRARRQPGQRRGRGTDGRGTPPGGAAWRWSSASARWGGRSTGCSGTRG